MEYDPGEPMTQEGAIAIATKMRRIWKPQHPPHISVSFRGQDCASWDIDILLDNSATVSVGLAYQMFIHASLHFRDERVSIPSSVSHCAAYENQTYGDENILAVFEYPENLTEFANRWIPMFRRGCFLVGVPFQHTQHEKMEWMLWYKELQAAEDARLLEDPTSDQAEWRPVIEDEMCME